MFAVEFYKTTGDAETQGAGLAGGTAAVDGGVNVVVFNCLGDGERLQQRLALHFRGEVVVDGTAVHSDGAGAGDETNPSNGALATAGGLAKRCRHRNIPR